MKDKDTEEEGKKRTVNMKGGTTGTKKRPDGATIAKMYYHPPRSLLPVAANELPN